MSIDPPAAAAALDDIDRIVQRVKQGQIYQTASATLVLWGVVVFAGYTANAIAQPFAAWIWLIAQLAGLVGTMYLGARSRRGRPHGHDLRIVFALLLFFGFGLLWSVGLGHMGPREMNAFWATLFMFGYTIAGLWFGRAFILLGLTITVLTMAGYTWAGSLFEPYMAVVDGGGLVLCGLWMRRA